VSPFSKPSYVSHTIGNHTSLLALIERQFLTINGVTQHLTQRDEHADPIRWKMCLTSITCRRWTRR